MRRRQYGASLPYSPNVRTKDRVRNWELGLNNGKFSQLYAFSGLFLSNLAVAKALVKCLRG